MSRMIALSIAAALTAPIACRTPSEAGDSTIQGIDVVDALEARGVPPGMIFVPVQGQDFAMQETEVTRGQWKAVMDHYPENLPGWNECEGREDTAFEDDHPVSCVSWHDANAFARRMTDKRGGYAEVYCTYANISAIPSRQCSAVTVPQRAD